MCCAGTFGNGDLSCPDRYPTWRPRAVAHDEVCDEATPLGELPASADPLLGSTRRQLRHMRKSKVQEQRAYLLRIMHCKRLECSIGCSLCGLVVRPCIKLLCNRRMSSQSSSSISWPPVLLPHPWSARVWNITRLTYASFMCRRGGSSMQDADGRIPSCAGFRSTRPIRMRHRGQVLAMIAALRPQQRAPTYLDPQQRSQIRHALDYLGAAGLIFSMGPLWSVAFRLVKTRVVRAKWSPQSAR